MKKKFFATGCLILMASVCTFGQVNSTLRPGEKVKAIFIAADSTDPNQAKLNKGAQAQAAKLKIEYVMKAPGKVDSAQQIALVEEAITAKYDIILLAPLNAAALVPVANKAKTAGIKLILVDSGLASGANYDVLIASNNAGAARNAADQFAKAVGGKGKIAIVGAQAGAGTIRESAFKEQLAKYKDITIVGTQNSDGDKTKAQNIAAEFIRANSDLAGIYACSEGATFGAANAVKQAGKKGKIVVVGWDLNPEIKAFVMDETIFLTVVQNHAVMGTKGIQAGIDLIQGKTSPKDVDSGTTIGTKANIAKLQ